MSLSLTPPDRRVITFYSYKGGVGRTMALANVAYRLANTHGLKVIVVDWDLEAPGLHRFFGISPEVAANTSGILDYFLAWRDAVRRNDPEPPTEAREVTNWILPIEDEKHKPKYGAVSVLLAGKQDKKYDQRLSRFDWRDFYADGAGAVAVENLREKLVEMADVVLIDSRTGLTDAGGICTIQIPDGVVLMTAPNDQSIEGTERVARGIAKASTDDRAERGQIKVWLVIARVPSVEESYLAQQWFERHEDWFDEGVELGLWLKDDHAEGIRSLEIPSTARWGFEEKVLHPGAGAGPRDPLARAYEDLTGTLLRWVRGEPALEPQLRDEAGASRTALKDIAAIEADVAKAEERGDILGMGISLVDLAMALDTAKRTSEGIRKLEQAIGIFMSRGARVHRLHALGIVGSLLLAEQRWEESREAVVRSLELSRELRDKASEALALGNLAGIEFYQGADEEAARLFEEALVIGQPFAARLPLSTWRTHRAAALYRSDRKEEGVAHLRQAVNAAHQKEDSKTEERALKMLLDLTTNDPLPDAAVLRARLEELNAAKPPRVA